MFGALKLHGPIITTVDGNNNLSGVEKNPNSWGRKHNMIYIDNPVGAGRGRSTAKLDYTVSLRVLIQRQTARDE